MTTLKATVAQAIRDSVAHEGEEIQDLAEKIGQFFDENGFPGADENQVIALACAVEGPDGARALERDGNLVISVIQDGVLVCVMNVETAKAELVHPMASELMDVVAAGAKVAFCVNTDVRFVVGRLDKMQFSDLN